MTIRQPSVARTVSIERLGLVEIVRADRHMRKNGGVAHRPWSLLIVNVWTMLPSADRLRQHGEAAMPAP